MEEVFAFLSHIHPLSDKCQDYLKKVVKFKKVSRKELLLKKGEINGYLYFIKKGALKCYYEHDGVYICDWFFFEGDTVVSVGSFYDQLPSVDWIEAMEDSEVYYLSKTDYDYLCKTCHDFSYIALVLMTKYLKIFHTHGRLIRHQSPFESYQAVLEQMPEMLQRVQGKDIASWLNMEAETLSRNKGEKKDKGTRKERRRKEKRRLGRQGRR